MTAVRVRWTGTRATSDRGTPLEGLVGWAGALLVGSGTWAALIWAVTR